MEIQGDRVVRTRLSLDAELAARQGRREAGSTAKRDLARYYGLLRDELAAIEFSRDEIGVVCEAIAFATLDEQSYVYLWAEVDTVLSRVDRLAGRWGITDANALITKIRGLRPAQVMALLDAAERCRVLTSSGMDTSTALGRLGLDKGLSAGEPAPVSHELAPAEDPGTHAVDETGGVAGAAPPSAAAAA